MIYRIPGIGGSIDLSTIVAIGPVEHVDLKDKRHIFFRVTMKEVVKSFAIGKDAPFGNNNYFGDVYKEVEDIQEQLTQTWEKWKKEQSSTGLTDTNSGESGEILET